MRFDFDLNLIIPYAITKYNSDLRIIHPNDLQDDERAHQLNRYIKNSLFTSPSLKKNFSIIPVAKKNTNLGIKKILDPKHESPPY